MAGAVRSLDQSILDQYRRTWRRRTARSRKPSSRRSTARRRRSRRSRRRSRRPTPRPAAAFPARRHPTGSICATTIRRRHAARLPQRILVLQGERDYQVTTSDFVRWQAALSGIPTAQFQAVPGAQPPVHARAPAGACPPSTSFPATCSLDVINDIATWIKSSLANWRRPAGISYAPFYDWENARTIGRRDVAFWRSSSRDQGGRALELGLRHRPYPDAAGAGGRRCDGCRSIRRMLARAASRVPAGWRGPRDRGWCCGDIRSPALSRSGVLAGAGALRRPAVADVRRRSRGRIGARRRAS